MAETVKADGDGAAPTEASRTNVERLYRETRDALAVYFRRRHRSREQAEDLLQETFLRLMRQIRRCLQADSPRAYLFGIARHVSMDAWRAREGAACVPEEAASDQADAAPDPRVAAARETIAGLPALHRDILNLRFEQDLSYAEITDVLGIPVGTVRSRMHYALLALRERLRVEEEP